MKRVGSGDAVPSALAKLALVAGLAGFLIGATPSPGRCMWASSGTPVCTAQGFQLRPSLARTDSALVFSWNDSRNNGTQVFLGAVSLHGDLAPGWPQDGIEISPRGVFAGTPVLMANERSAFLFWYDRRTGHPAVYGTRILQNGLVAPGWVLSGNAIAADTVSRYVSAVCSDSEGGVFIAVQSVDLNQHSSTRLHRLDSLGVSIPGWSAGGVPIGTDSLSNSQARVVGDSADGAWVAWIAAPDSLGIFATHVTGSGSFESGWSSAGLPVSLVASEKETPSIATDATGGAYVGWNDSREKSYDFYAMHLLDLAGRDGIWPPGGAKLFGTASAFRIHGTIVADLKGGVFASCVDYRNHGQVPAIQRFSALGTPVGSWPDSGVLVSSGANNGVSSVSVVPDSGGGAFISWCEVRDFSTTAHDIFLQHYDPSGAQQVSWPVNGLAVCAVPEVQREPALCLVASDLVAVLWDDDRLGPTSDLYMAAVSADGVVPVMLAHGSASIAGATVELRWNLAFLAGAAVTLVRRLEDSVWTAIEDADFDGRGELVLRDQVTVQRATRCEYQLLGRVDREPRSEAIVITLQPELPTSTVELLGNPLSNASVLRLHIAKSVPTSVEFFDAGGRRVAKLELGSLSSGIHDVPLGSLNGRAPGVYEVRVELGAQQMRKRVLVLR